MHCFIRFQLTEGFRMKLRNSKPEIGGTHPLFVARLDEYLHRWTDLAKASTDYDGLKDLILREQFMQTSNKNLQVFLKERKVRSVHEMAELAEQYNKAHGPNKIRAKLHEGKTNPFDIPRGRQIFQLPDRPRSDDKYCYNCKSPTHFIRDCPKMVSVRGKPVRSASLSEHISIRGIRGGYRSFRGQSRGISILGNRGRGGHDNRIGTREIENTSLDATETKNIASFAVHEGDCYSEEDTVKLVCGHELPIMNAACDSKIYCGKLDNMPVSDGYVEDNRVKVLRDTGCSSVVVRRDVVLNDKLTGSIQMCVLLNGTDRKFPVARISVSSPYFTGNCEALCSENPVYDLILGNIPGVRNPSEPNLSWGKKEVISQDNESACVIHTRAQKAQESKTTVLNVPSAISGVNKDELKKAQEKDDRLKDARKQVLTGERKTSTGGVVNSIMD